MKKTISLTVVAALLSACATTPEPTAELESARDSVQAIQTRDMAGQVAGAELEQAKAELRRAERAFEEREGRAIVNHHAYLANRHVDVIRERVAEAEARNQIESAEAERQRVLLESREREAQRATAAARQAQAAAAANAAEAERQRERAQQAIRQSRSLAEELEDFKSRESQRGMVLTLSDVLFDTGKAELKPGARSAVDSLVSYLNDNPDRSLRIEGHTDSRGDAAFNQTLSLQRAQALSAALEEAGVAADRLEAVGHGESQPVATNETTAGRQENRRVEIVISDADGQFPDDATRAQSTALR